MRRKHRSASSRNDGWYDQLQAAILELITCRDIGDSVDEEEVGTERRPPWSWWECAEIDCGGLEVEERSRRRHFVEHRPTAGTSEVPALEEWSTFDAYEAPSLLPPVPLPKPRGCEENEPSANKPRLTNLIASGNGKKLQEASPAPRLGDDNSRLTKVNVQDTVVFHSEAKRMGPAQLCPAVPQKLGDHPAPSFQVGMSFLEPFSGLSTASSLQPKQVPKQPGGGMVLQVLLQNDRWVSLHFNRNDDLMRRTCEFLQEHKLSNLVKDGLLNQLKQMVTMRQLSACVDVVDLL